ncbi:MAG: DUF4198 domain-containing protein [Thiohalobacteraceae bacterium]
MRGFTFVVLMLAAFSVPAHELWLDKAGGRYTLFQGHRHAAHAGAEQAPYEPAAVKTAMCLGSDGASMSLVPGTGYPVVLTGDCAAVLVSFSTGYWTKTAWETRNVPKTGVAGVMKSWLSEDSVKRIDRWTQATALPIGAGLEITPASDPFKVAIGDKLIVIVTENKRPLAGVPVAYQGDVRGVTGRDGRIAIRLRQSGVQLISASTEVPLDDGKADIAIRATAVQFELPE